MMVRRRRIYQEEKFLLAFLMRPCHDSFTYVDSANLASKVLINSYA
jgi:hypothetical protein